MRGDVKNVESLKDIVSRRDVRRREQIASDEISTESKEGLKKKAHAEKWNLDA